MGGYLFGLIVVSFTTALAVTGMIIVRRYVTLPTLITYHEVAGHMLSVVGTLYAVLLGFVIVDAMQHMQDVRSMVSMEASGLANIYLASEGLPDPRKSEIRRLCVEYAHEVIDDEWITLRERKYSQKTFSTVFKLWKQITTYDPVTQREQGLQQQLVSEICSMTQNHRTRVIASMRGVAPVMWFVLVTGGVFTIIFTYFFGVANMRIQSLMTVLVAMTLSLNVYLVYVFGNPMATDLGIKPGPFQLDLLIFQSFERGEMPPAKPMNN
jgi:hypothetical protein